jgi:hypothetical protein
VLFVPRLAISLSSDGREVTKYKAIHIPDLLLMPADEMLADAKWKNALAIGGHWEAEMLSRKSTSRDRPAAVGSNRQGAIDLRASASTVERGIRSRSLQGMILTQSLSSRSYDDDCLRLLAALPHCQNGAQK